MNMEELRKKLEQELEKRIEETMEGLPPKFEFEEGTELFAEVVDIQKNPWRNDDSKIYIVKNLEDEQIYRLPSHKVLETELDSQNAEKGDIILVKLVSTYQKEAEGGETRTVNVYRAVVHKQKKEEQASDDEIKNYVAELLKLFNGKIPKDQFKHFIEEVRGWKVEDALRAGGVKEEGDFIVGA